MDPLSAGLMAAGTIGGSVAGGLLSKSAPDTSWQIPIQTQHDFDMFNLNQNRDWAMLNANQQFNMSYAQDQYDKALGQFYLQSGFNREMAARQEAFQREVGQNSIGWRVEDAARAGVSPLVALGAPTFNPSPISIGGFGIGGTPATPGPLGSSIGASGIGASGGGGQDFSWLGKMGANLGDIVGKALREEDKVQVARDDILWNQKQRSNELDIAIKQATLRGIQGRNSIPSPDGGATKSGQSVLGNMSIEPAKVTAAMPGGEYAQAGIYSDVQYNRGPNGLYPVPSKDSRISDSDTSSVEYMRWAGRHLEGQTPPPMPAGRVFPGASDWSWNQFRLRWEPTYPNGYYQGGQFVPNRRDPAIRDEYYGSY